MTSVFLFVTAISGMVWAAGPSGTPTSKSTKHGKIKHHSKKSGNPKPSSKVETTVK
jgi:hypothetical protein